MLKCLSLSQFPLLKKMCTSNKNYLNLCQLDKKIYESLRKKTKILKKERICVNLPDEHLKIVKFEECFPLMSHGLKHQYRIDTQCLEAKVVSKEYIDSCRSSCESDLKNNYSIMGSINANHNHLDFLSSYTQLKINMVDKYEQNKIYNHIIELIDVFAAQVVYKHSMCDYKENNKYNFVTALFNSLTIYEKNKDYHDLCFSLNKEKSIKINCYIVHYGTTSYILKVDLFQDNKLVFDIYSTFVNVNKLTLKPQSVADVNNCTKNEEYEQIKSFAAHQKDIQSLFNHKHVINTYLHKNDIDFLLNYFKDIKVEKKPYIEEIYHNTNIYDLPNEKASAQSENTLSIIDHILDRTDISFYIGKSNFYCKDSYNESNYFISSEYKNIHNITFGGHLAYLSFCHAMVIIKKFVQYPKLIEINDIQYISPVPYNSTVLFKGRVVYSDEKKVQILISANYFDFKKGKHFLTNIFNLSFENNCCISFIPQSNEEIKTYFLNYIRSQLMH